MAAIAAGAVLAADAKGRRRKVPRSLHGEREPPAARDPLATLADQDRDRVAELVPIRYGRMLSSPFAFFRGGAAVMAADLGAVPDTGLRVQLCGDAHLSNFGIFAAPDRLRAMEATGRAYLGGGKAFDRVIAEFAERYADRDERDYAALPAAGKRGEIEVARGL